MKEMCNDFLKEENTASNRTTRRCSCPNNGSTDDMLIEQDCDSWLIGKMGLAQAYVPFQPNADTMTAEQSLICGTAFSDLVVPYVQGSNLVKFL